jgi:membrane-anchored protein YejM (alkaline phosphatase superfamily)
MTFFRMDHNDKKLSMDISQKRRIIWKSLFCFLAINVVLTVLIGYQYLTHAVGVEGWLDYVYLHLALLSNFFILYIAIGIVLFIILSIFPGKPLLFMLSVPVMLCLHILMFVDLSIYRIFKFHINSMVINLFQTEGAWDSVHLGTVTLITAGIVIIAFVLFAVLTLNALYKRFNTDGQRNLTRFPKGRHVKITMVLILVIILSDKFTYAIADFYNTYQITRHRTVFPLYGGFTMKRFLGKHFHVNVNREEDLQFSTKTSPLNYPKAGLERKPLATYPNILWMLIDAWRADMLNPQVSPHIWEFSKKAFVFKNHYSGGNASRFGIFSLFYGVYAYYWHQFLGARQGAVLIDELVNLGYELRIISSTRLTYPEFRKTAFVKIPDAIDDARKGNGAAERDPETAQRFIEWLGNRTSTAPFFSFLFFDAPHGPYSYPDEFEKFTPSQKTANYVTVGKKDMVPLKNSYRNAIYFDDSQVGKILDYLENNGFLKNTIILISADHGEEFYESGFFGHTSAFTKEQTKVPLILYLPDRPSEEITRLTSHLDVVPTMLAILGYTSPPSLYSQGFSLLEPRERDFVVSCGWADCSIIDGSNTIVFSTETYNAYLFEIRDEYYQNVPDRKAVLNTKYTHIMAVAQGLGEFNK